MLKNKDNMYPWILCIGTPCNISSSVLVCQRKVVTNEIGQSIFSALLVLMAVHYTYDFAYNPLVQQALEFLQEKLLGDQLPKSRKISVAYSSLFRAIDCIEQKLVKDSANNDDSDPEYTQALCELD